MTAELFWDADLVEEPVPVAVHPAFIAAGAIPVSGYAVALYGEAVAGSLWDRERDRSASIDVVNDWVIGQVDGCTCGGGGILPHEPYCGWEPLRHLDRGSA